ncbi:MAG: hypothetical protein ACOH1N_14275 [Lutibacter sp.]
MKRKELQKENNPIQVFDKLALALSPLHFTLYTFTFTLSPLHFKL